MGWNPLYIIDRAAVFNSPLLDLDTQLFVLQITSAEINDDFYIKIHEKYLKNKFYSKLV